MKTPDSFAHLPGLKSLGYSYPSSPNAVAAGKPNGCWTVSLGSQRANSFDSQQEAIDFAKTLDREWDYYTRICYPEVLA